MLELRQVGRFMEAEALERHLVIVLSQSETTELMIAHALLSEPCETARNRISATEMALRFLEYRLSSGN